MIKVIKSEKNMLEVEIDNLTLAEVLREELWNDDAVETAAWRRDHPSKNPVLLLQTKEKTAKKALLDAASRVEKLNDSVLDEFKKAVK